MTMLRWTPPKSNTKEKTILKWITEVETIRAITPLTDKWGTTTIK
ncbi:hypothetical protein [Flagellimonas baculiformis]|jgi:hypothetical protein